MLLAAKESIIQIKLLQFHIVSLISYFLEDVDCTGGRIFLVISFIPKHEVHGMTTENKEGNVNIFANLKKVIIVVHHIWINPIDLYLKVLDQF